MSVGRAILRTCCAVTLAAAALPWAALAASTPGVIAFTDAEIRAIAQHGPWPVKAPRDPSNRVSGNAAAIALGERVFFDPRFSVRGNVSCATCHIPERHWTDGRKVATGLGEVDRNTPSITNVALNRWFGWDGANDSLWAQSLRPMTDEREMGASDRHVAALVRSDADLQCRYRKAFGSGPGSDDEAVFVDIAKALAAFQETQVSARTPFDDFRDALVRRDFAAAGRYPESAQRGLKVFVGKGSCNLCHFGPNFTHGEFHEVGIPIYRKTGGVDWGRHQGIKQLLASRFNLLGRYSDDAARSTAVSTQHVVLAPQTFEQFRVPSLRNVALTAPYMHNGHLATLREVVRHYSVIDVSMLHAAHIYLSGEDDIAEPPPTDKLLKRLDLSEREIDDVVAFLETLSERGGPRKNARPPVSTPCR